jgi:hypothetical protein
MVLFTIFIILIVAYLVLYLGGRKYLETFEDVPVKKNSSRIPPPERPYSMQPIDKIDDYEVSAVFYNEGSKEVLQKHRNEAMAQYPLDWSNQGPNSQYFQEKQAEFQKKMKPQLTSQLLEEGFDATLPDALQQDEEEKKILQTYQPKCTKDLLEYCVEDVKSLVDKVYDKKGLIPVLEKSKQGNNIWEITELKEKNPKIVWEDDPEETEQRGIQRERGENVIEVPQTASDLSAGLDPFFQMRNPYRTQSNDFTQWTPGLERMFAPTQPVKSWF